MECPYCRSKTEVINSRPQKRSNQIWRRRRCSRCQAVFTTHELIDLSSSFMVSHKAANAPFSSDLLFKELLDNLKGHQRPYEAARELTATITRKVLKSAANGLISPLLISHETAAVLKRFDSRAHLRYIADHPSVRD